MMMLMYVMQWMALTIGSSVIQRNWGIPLPITLLTGVIVGNAVGLPLFNAKLNDGGFDLLIMLTLPLLIAADALKMRWEDIKRHGWSLFLTAGVNVFLAVGAGLLVNQYVLGQYHLTTAAVVVLFSMLVATDPITVSAIFSNVKVPHQLKVLTEGESLFNDAAALIVFSLGVMALADPDKVSGFFIVQKIGMVVGGALIIGLVVGAVCAAALQLSDDPFVEATILMLGAYVSYSAAEHFHFSGILAIIVAMLLVGTVIARFLDREEKEHASDFSFMPTALRNVVRTYELTSVANTHTVQNAVQFVALLASVALFISIGVLTELAVLWQYRWEILAVFVATTAIRAGLMLKFVTVSRWTHRMHTVPLHWGAVLTFAGSKGALSILMVHLVPSTFEYKELFEHIVIGNILLSILVYAPVLLLTMRVFRERFEQESLADPSHH